MIQSALASSIDVKISFHAEDRQLIKKIPNQITVVHIQKFNHLLP